MHILLIPSWYKSPVSKIGGSFFEEQAWALQDKGHKVGVLVPTFTRFSKRFSKAEGLQTATDFNDNGLPTYYCHYYGIIPRSKKLNYHWFCQKAERKFREYVDQHGEPDILHAHAARFGGFAAQYISHKHNIPYFVTEHFTGLIKGAPHELKLPTDLSWIESVYKESQKVIVVSHFFKKSLIEKFNLPPSTFKVIPNMVADHFFEDLQPLPPAPPFQLLTISFLKPQKNHKLLFRAFKQVLKEYPQTILKVGGHGALEDELKKFVKKLGISKNVQFLGTLSREEVKHQMQQSHAFVLSSRVETFGVVLIESLACGRPVITTDSGGPKDIVSNKNGILVKEHTPKALSGSISKLIENYHSYKYRDISGTCKEKFSQLTIMNRLNHLYQTNLAVE